MAQALAKAAESPMLTVATLGMVGYGLYSVGYGVVDLIAFQRLEVWVNIAVILLGVLLVIAAALVRVSFPGGLALAIGALLALQAFAIHNAAHLHGSVLLAPQLARGAFAAALAALAYTGSRGDHQRQT